LSYVTVEEMLSLLFCSLVADKNISLLKKHYCNSEGWGTACFLSFSTSTKCLGTLSSGYERMLPLMQLGFPAFNWMKLLTCLQMLLLVILDFNVHFNLEYL